MGNFKRRADVRAAWEDKVKEIEPDVFGTLKLYHGRKIKPEYAHRAFKRFWHDADYHNPRVGGSSPSSATKNPREINVLCARTRILMCKIL